MILIIYLFFVICINLTSYIIYEFIIGELFLNNYISELAGICKLPLEAISKNFKLIWFGTTGLYVANFKKIIDYSQDKVVLKINNNTLEIMGRELLISLINKGEILIKGRINSVSLGVVNEKSK